MSTEPWYNCDNITYQDICISLKMRLKSTLENKVLLDASIKEIVSNDTMLNYIDEDYKARIIERYYSISNTT